MKKPYDIRERSQVTIIDHPDGEFGRVHLEKISFQVLEMKPSEETVSGWMEVICAEFSSIKSCEKWIKKNNGYVCGRRWC